MLRKALIVAGRQLFARRLHSAINIFGLALGLATVILIGLYVQRESGYDGQWANAERIYRISRDYFPREGAHAQSPAGNVAPLAPALSEEFPEIEAAARLQGLGSSRLERGGLVDDELRVRRADNAIFEIFDFGWIAGDPKTALLAPYSIVLTQSLAAKYFGAEDPMGQTILDSGSPLEVTGVIRDLPERTHLSVDALVSLGTLFSLLEPEFPSRWDGPPVFDTYVLLRKGADVKSVEDRLPELMRRRIGPDASWSGMTVMNIRDIHLRSKRDDEWKPSGGIAAVRGFAALAVLILLIACINFTNLSTASAVTRAREVGVRKSLGATRGRLVARFLLESIATAALATLLALALVEIALPAMPAWSGVKLELTYGAPLLYALIGLVLSVGVLAGAYPAFYLSAFQPARVLKGDLAGGATGTSFRSALIVVQFAIAIGLGVAAAVILSQLRFAHHRELGFDREHIVVARSGPSGLAPQWPALKQELLKQPGVIGVAASYDTPFTLSDNPVSFRPEGGEAASRMQWLPVDYDFFETYRIQVLAGRSFSPNFPSDALVAPTAAAAATSAAFVINEAAARELGWSVSAAVGRRLELGRDPSFSLRAAGPVVGVVSNTSFESARVPVRPIVYGLYPALLAPRFFMINGLSIRVASTHLADTLEHIDATWAKFHPEFPIHRHFLAADFDALYRDDARDGRMIGAFSLLAVSIACLGLLGLAWFATETRTKEIGIRKAIGGTVWDIARLFVAQFDALVLVACAIGWPIAYYAMRRWLEGFVYRIDLSIWLFIGGAMAALLCATLTVGCVAVRAATAKPLHALRNE